MSDVTPSIVIAGVKETKAVDAQAVSLTVEAVIGGQRSEIEIAIATELAPQVALALLATVAQERSKRDELAPALEPIAIGIVPSASDAKVRLHLLFDRGTVLPVELERPAAHRLRVALSDEFKDGSGEPPSESLDHPVRSPHANRDGSPRKAPGDAGTE